jgi:hypothetical protein
MVRNAKAARVRAKGETEEGKGGLFPYLLFAPCQQQRSLSDPDGMRSRLLEDGFTPDSTRRAYQYHDDGAESFARFRLLRLRPAGGGDFEM